MDKNIGFELYGKFRKLYSDAHQGQHPAVSIYAGASMMKRIAGDIGVEFTYDLINYYFDNRKFHDFMWFTYNYHTLIDEMHYKAKDEDKRERLRKVTRERMIELGIPVGIDEQTQSQEEPQLTLKED